MAVLLVASSCSDQFAEAPVSEPISASETPVVPEPAPTPTAVAPTPVPASTPVPAGPAPAPAPTPNEPVEPDEPAPVLAEPEPVEPIGDERDCSPSVPGDFRLSTTELAPASLEIARAAYSCAQEVGIALAWDRDAIATLASRGLRGPLLLLGSWFDPPFVAELGRLAPRRIVAAGFEERVLRRSLSDFNFELIAVDEQAAFPSGGEGYERVWLVDDSSSAAILDVLGRQIGAAVVAVPGDLRAVPPETREVIADAAEVDALFSLDDEAAWQLAVVRRGDEIPGGGLLMFDAGFNRRLVAIYGHPSGSALGVLGEQGAQEGVERLRAISEGYDADGSVVLPTFEIIATVASASAGSDGDYSAETAREVIRPWVEAAAASDVYVVLDLQPGRTDFLTQARYYEEFLRLPHVGLALDPEWRLKPGQVHLRQIGTVDAAEVNRVVEWLAGIVREEALPQKLLIVHQFRLDMITNRRLIKTPPELAVLIQMDGQGPLSSKYNTWNFLTRESDADRLHWGWKNFYDEDSPMATPEQVLDLVPYPAFVSFQ